MRGANGVDQLAASMEGYGLALQTQPLKPAALQGQTGYLSFGPAGGSYYYPRTRLQVAGTLTDHGQGRPVHGEAWFDHQWGNFLVVGAGGWDWYSLQLDDGSELSFSVVRDQQGNVPLAYGISVDPHGVTTY